MGMRHTPVIICAALLLFTAAHAEKVEEQGPSWKQGMVGVVVNGIAAGVQLEYRFIRPLGVRVMGAYIYGLGKKHGPVVNRGETMLSMHAAPVVYIPTPVKFLEPLLFFGLAYSHYRWKSSYFKINGIINDVTFGGGGGLGFIITPFCRIGINCWINYDYRTVENFGRKKKGNRFALVMPFLDVSFLF